MSITTTRLPADHVAAWNVVEVSGTSNALSTPVRENLRIKVTVSIGGVAHVYYEPTWITMGTTSAFKTDISPVLRSALTSPVVTFPATITPGNAAVTYTIQLTEIYDVSGVVTTGATTGSLSGYVAHRSADISGRTFSSLVNGLPLQHTTGTRRYVKDMYIPIDFIYTGAGDVEGPDGTAITVTNGRGCVFIDADGFDPNNINVYVFESDAGKVTTSVTYVYDQACYPDGMVLYFLNRFGGYEVYHFVDTETIAASGESEVITTRDWSGNITRRKLPKTNTVQMRLVGRMETADTAEYLRDLITSPEVFDIDGNKVYVVSDNLNIYEQGEFRPVVEIIKEITPCIGY